MPPYPSATKAVDLPVLPPASAGAPAPSSQVRVIPLWPEGVPNAKAGAGEEQTVDGRVTNVQVPTITFYPAAAQSAAGTAIIVAPGGSYQRLAIDKEGSALAALWNEFGVSVFVLKYRLAEFGHPAPLQDVLRAIRLVRSRASEFGVREIASVSSGLRLEATSRRPRERCTRMQRVRPGPRWTASRRGRTSWRCSTRS